MARYASNYLLLPDQTLLRQQVIEVEEGRVTRHFPLTAEIADTQWLPGLICLVAGEEEDIINEGAKNGSVKKRSGDKKESEVSELSAYYYASFDIRLFHEAQFSFSLFCETPHRRLM